MLSAIFYNPTKNSKKTKKLHKNECRNLYIFYLKIA